MGSGWSSISQRGTPTSNLGLLRVSLPKFSRKMNEIGPRGGRPWQWRKVVDLYHPAWRALTSDWYINSFIMIYDNFLVLIWPSSHTETYGWSWIQYFPDGGGTNLKGGVGAPIFYLANIFPKSVWKLKKLDLEGTYPATPPSPVGSTSVW